MLKNLTTRIIATMFAMCLLLAFNAPASNRSQAEEFEQTANSQKSCSKTTDQELIQAVKEKFEADAEIKDQMSHLNVSVKKRTVKLEGWLGSEELILKAIGIARGTICVKNVKSKLKTRGGGSCGQGLKPCGTLCIDRDSACTIGISKGE